MLARLGVWLRRLWIVLSAVLVVVLLPSHAWSLSDDHAATSSPSDASSSTGPSPEDPSDTGLSTSEPSPTSTEPPAPTDPAEPTPVEVLVEVEDVTLSEDQWTQLEAFGWALSIGVGLLVLAGFAGVIASFGRGNYVS